jgi:hypothetical protein
MEEMESECTTEKRQKDWTNSPLGDILWKGPAGPVILDLVITHPQPRSDPKVATVPGAAASKAHNDKVKKYCRRFEIPAGQFEPIAVETGGRLHPSARRTLTAFVKWTLGLGCEEKVPPDLAYKYQRALRSVLDSLSVSLAREVAGALLSGGPGHARAPAEARRRDMGVVGEPIH